MEVRGKRLNRTNTEELSMVISHSYRRLKLSPMDNETNDIVMSHAVKAEKCLSNYRNLGILRRIIKSSDAFTDYYTSVLELATVMKAWETKNTELINLLKEADGLLNKSPIESLKRYHSIAQQGLADAQYKLGLIHFRGLRQLNKDGQISVLLLSSPAEGIEHLTRASNQGHVMSTLHLAFCNMFGLGKDADLERALKLAKPVIEELEVKSEEGYTFAKAELAFCYLWGLHYSVNHRKAFESFKVAGAKGFARAQSMVGLCYLDGVGLEGEKESHAGTSASFWLRMAVGRDNGFAELALSENHRRGYGVDKVNMEVAQELLIAGLQKADESDPIVQCFIAQASFFGFTSGLNYKHNAFDLWETSAKAGYWRSQFWLGWCYHTGSQVPMDKEKAVQYWEQSSKSGFWLSQKALSDCYRLGEGVDKDLSQADELEKQATKYESRLGKEELEALSWVKEYSVANFKQEVLRASVGKESPKGILDNGCFSLPGSKSSSVSESEETKEIEGHPKIFTEIVSHNSDTECLSPEKGKSKKGGRRKVTFAETPNETFLVRGNSLGKAHLLAFPEKEAFVPVIGA